MDKRIDITIIKDFFREYVDHILNDLMQMIKDNKGLNYPIVMTILASIEGLGSAYVGGSKNGFEEFIRAFFPSKYHQHIKIFYELVRDGLAHKGTPKRGIGIARGRESKKWHLVRGIEKEGWRFIIHADLFFSDYEKAVRQFKREVMSNIGAYRNLLNYKDKLDRYPEKSLINHWSKGAIDTKYTAESVTGASGMPFSYK